MSLEALRTAATRGDAVDLRTADGSATTSIKEAASINIDSTLYSLDEVTNFYNEDKPQTLRAVVFAWIHDKLLIVDYRNECVENGVADFKFIVKTELSSWLSGKSDHCEYIRGPDARIDSSEKSSNDNSNNNSNNSNNNSSNNAGDTTTSSSAGGQEDSKISGENNGTDTSSTNKRLAPGDAGNSATKRQNKFEHERESVDHNSVLRGTKNINFGYLILDAKKLILQLKKGKSGSLRDGKLAGNSGDRKVKQPIIIVSPATTALLSLSNIKEFFENGRFVDPTTLKRPNEGIVTIKHRMERVVPVAQEIMVVDSVDLFTKPEYWDRVVAVFTTGQSWQFSKYKYPKPEMLFQKYPGFYVSYLGDVTPKQIKDWNINEIKVDRGEKRFRDKMIVRDFWASLERILVQKGYGV